MPRPATRADVLHAVRALPSTRTRFVGVDGFGGAGKTSLAEAIAADVPDVTIVHGDDLQGVGIAAWDWTSLVRDVVTPLRAGRPARYALRSWGQTRPSGHADVPVGGIVVVEGVSVTRREAVVPWDLTVWVDAPEDVRRARTLARDGDALQSLWRDEWIPMEQAWAARDRPRERVDLVVDAGRPGHGENLGEWSAP